MITFNNQRAKLGQGSCGFHDWLTDWLIRYRNTLDWAPTCTTRFTKPAYAHLLEVLLPKAVRPVESWGWNKALVSSWLWGGPRYCPEVKNPSLGSCCSPVRTSASTLTVMGNKLLWVSAPVPSSQFVSSGIMGILWFSSQQPCPEQASKSACAYCTLTA